MIFKKVNMIFLQFVVWGTFIYANDCPKWFPMPANNGLVVVLPIYDEAITERDMDCDGIIDTLDSDIDGDGVANTKDTFPLNSYESIDTDGDGIGNNADTDDDNDGTVDTEDSNPLVNEVPIAHAGDDQRIEADSRVILDGSASSDDGNILTYSWVLTDKPEGSTATLNNSSIVSPIFDADKVGTYRLELTVSDGQLTSMKDVIFINVGRESMLVNYDDGIHGREPWITDGTPEGTHLLKDINIKNESSNIANLVNTGDVIYFSVNGNELWKSDGTEDGTVKVKEFSSYTNLREFTIVDNILYFINNSQLWKSNGTEAGTVQINGYFSYINTLVEFQNNLYFSAIAGSYGYELWKSDGTENGTEMIKDIKEGEESSFPSNFKTVGNILYFTVKKADGSADELWKTDGTETNTELIKDFNSITYQDILHLVDRNGTLYFTMDDGTHGRELWKSDGSSIGTVMVEDINLGSDSSNPENLISMNNVLYFTVYNNYETQLWKSSDDNTVMVTNLVSSIDKFVSMNNKLYFFNNSALWESDGTDEGTHVVNDLIESFSDLININNTLYFYVGLPGDRSLYKSDGTVEGTIEIKNFEYDIYYGDDSFFNFNDQLFFIANDGINGNELWKSDGTSDGTSMVKNISTKTFSSLDYSDNPFIKIDNTYYFVADDGIHGRELWKSDGTEAGTHLVKDIWDGTNSSGIAELCSMNNILYFTASNGMNGNRIWMSDGSIDGTVMLSTTLTLNTENLTVLNNTLYFTYRDNLWLTNGTEDGTMFLKNVENKILQNFKILNNILYFTGKDYTDKSEFWRSDGTKDGTYMIQNNLENFEHLVSFNKNLYFTANNTMNETRLWQSDGTDIGTKLLNNIIINNINYLTVVDNNLYFSGNYGGELWKFNDQENNTRLIKKNFFYGIGSFTAVNDTLYYLNRYELWMVNSTNENSLIYNTYENSMIDILASSNGELIFNTEHMLWKTNETETIQLTP